MVVNKNFISLTPILFAKALIPRMEFAINNKPNRLNRLNKSTKNYLDLLYPKKIIFRGICCTKDCL